MRRFLVLQSDINYANLYIAKWSSYNFNFLSSMIPFLWFWRLRDNCNVIVIKMNFWNYNFIIVYLRDTALSAEQG